LKFSRDEFMERMGKIKDLGIEDQLFPTYLATYRIHNPMLNVDQEITSYFAFDPEISMIVADWRKE